MSRLCVKNLPKYVGEDKLRDFFSRKGGEVTDAKLMRTKDGKSRQFAFIGFRTEKEAEEALNYFNNAYMDASRITCEIARKVGDPNIPRPWSRYSAEKAKHSSEGNEGKLGLGASKCQGSSDNVQRSSKSNEKNDPQLQEFLQVMQPRVKSKLWANDTLVTANAVNKDVKAGKDGFKKKHSAQVHIQETDGSKIIPGTPSKFTHEESAETSSPNKSNEMSQDVAISNMDYFKSRVKKDWSDSESEDEDVSKEGTGDEKNPSQEVDEESHDVDTKATRANAGQQQVELKDYSTPEDSVDDNNDKDSTKLTLNDHENQALETGRLFVRNLPYTTNEDELFELFSKFGDVSQVHLVIDKATKRSKGIAYVLFTLPESAVRALEELDNIIFQGRLLHVMPAKPQDSSNGKQESKYVSGQDTKTFKQHREEHRKASEASGDTRSWNSLFMRSDTVVENIARKHGISKTELLDREADDTAVRIALGETQVIAETKKALSSARVNISALEGHASNKTEDLKRSKEVILVKNLPYSTGEKDLADMFGRFGSLEKIILPSTKVLALVIFLQAAEARAAFKGLAYKRYKDAPLYLEWAPSNILSPDPTTVRDDRLNPLRNEIAKSVLLGKHLQDIPEEEIDPDRVESRSVFVKNLNFKTTDESLRKHFIDNMKKGSIKSVKVKKHIKNGKNVSFGFGFVEFDSVETATNICKELQGSILDGHALIMQLCHAKTDGKVLKKDEKDKSSTKLIVRNVAFEATEKDLRQLFSSFGQIKSLRLPMKFGSHRGFAFVEFVTKQEAQSALQALSSTHLYGRHLVLEQAKSGETLEELRARTAAQFVNEDNGFQKLSEKKRKLTNVLDEANVKFKRIMG